VLLATAAAIYALGVRHADFQGFVLAVGIPLLIWVGGAYALLLSARLALIALGVPLLAWLWWVALVGALGGWAASYEAFVATSLGFGVAGAILASLELHALANAIARGTEVQDAARAVLKRGTVLAIVIVLAACTGAAALVYPDMQLALAISLAALIMLPTCWALPPLVASLLPFSESYFARVNRTREWRERLISVLAIFSIPRWALAMVGIVAIVAAIVYFDRAFSPLWQSAGSDFAALCAALGLIAALATRNWRHLVSCGVTVFFSALLGAWLALRLGADIDLVAQSTFILAGAVGAPLVYALGLPMASHQRLGEPMMIACAQALNQAGSAVLCLGLTATLAVLAGALQHGVSPALALMPLVLLGGAMKVFVAFATAMDDLFPRRRSLEELYRAR
jgi:hypothetical protein